VTVLFLDEIHRYADWAAKLKGHWDRIRRKRIQIHVVATGSSALHVATGSRQSLAGRFERLTLSHWPAASLADTFHRSREEAVQSVVRFGSYPGALELEKNPVRWRAYLLDAIIEPAIGRDVLALGAVPGPRLQFFPSSLRLNDPSSPLRHRVLFQLAGSQA
jgi:hypothetical protein